LTFVKTDMRYGALGHPICDQNGEIISTRNGNIYNASISGVIKGEKGKAGELRGTFAVEEKIGSLVNNCKYGVYGKLDSLPTELSKKDLIKVASPYEVKPGKATVYSTLDENGRMEYEIEIVKVSTQNMKGDKGLVLRVSDTRLLEKTGGIVQGMSGSPIVQNGKLVGAVTHVFINDPTKGYGVLGQWMLDNN
ncbi:MAG: SpoIVB peptidase S55 domain-containing protein, partial [Clostridia bacterium]